MNMMVITERHFGARSVTTSRKQSAVDWRSQHGSTDRTDETFHCAVETAGSPTRNQVT
jgi:hypothetical protein